MLAAATLRTRLSTVPLTDEYGPWSRVVAYEYLVGPPPGAPPTARPNPLWPGGSRINGQRFTPKGSFDTAYLTQDPVTALLEVQAVMSIGGYVRLAGANPQVVVTILGTVANVLDTTDPTVRAALRTSTSELTGVWAYVPGGAIAPTQLLGQLAYDGGRIHGIKYTSSKNPPATCLCVFPERLHAPERLSVIDGSGNLVSELP